jgi:hypothetical protein
MKTMPSATVGLALKPPGGWVPVGGCSWNVHAAWRLPALPSLIVAGPAVADGWRAENR